jgi:DNA polymerase I-like protein with 3'-5' exonuclease and polymerase domains
MPRTSKPLPEAQPYARTLFAQLARPFIMPASGRGEGLRLIFDLEADGLLDTATCVHCIVIDDLASDRVHEYGPSQIAEALAHLARADVLIGHYIQGYDLPVLRKLHGWAPRFECRIVDTLIAARLILPHLADIDAEIAARAKDAAFGQVHGKYSLEAWGCRLGMPKIGAELDDFSKWTPELQARCVGDVALCKRLYQFLQPDGYGRAALELEHRVAVICDQITADGVPFDTAAAEQLREQWQTRRAVLETRLREQFPEVNNFHSRMQITTVLEARGWQPERRTKKSKQPVIDDELLESLPATYPEFEGLAEHYILGRRLAQLATGAQAWIGNVHADGRIHGGLIHIGTPHGRATHLHPNMAQVPNHKKGTPFAAECRALFRHPDDWVFVTCDQSNLQDRGFAHYLAAHDGGAYARTFADGIDQHWQTAIALDLIPEGTVRDKDSKVHTAIREGAKTFRFAFLFGAGALGAGQSIARIGRTVTRIAPDNALGAQFWTGNKHPSEAVLQRTGRRVLERFIAATPGLLALRASLSAEHQRHGWVEGLDGRRIPTAADYKALNRIVTAAEAVICKRWLIDVHAELCSQFRYGPDGDAYLALWVHDEIVICCRPAIAERVGEILIHHARKAGEPYDFRVPLDAVCSSGRDWAGTPLKTTPSPRTAPPESKIETPINGAKVCAAPVKALIILPSVQTPPVNGKIRCPFHDERTPSCQLYPDGHYHCFGCGAHGRIDELDGISEDMFAELAAHEQDDDTQTLKRALKLWDDGKPISDTLVERYLADTRKIDLAGLPPAVDAVLRFHPRCPFGPNTRHPCLLALFRDIELDTPAGIHRIALTPDAKKIGRMMLGRWSGTRAIKLWPAGLAGHRRGHRDRASCGHANRSPQRTAAPGLGHRLEHRHRQLPPAHRRRAAHHPGGPRCQRRRLQQRQGLRPALDRGRTQGRTANSATERRRLQRLRARRRLGARRVDMVKITVTQFDGYTEELWESDDPPAKSNGAGTSNGQDTTGAATSEPAWPVMAPAAYHGLAGEVVTTLLPHTESDPVALLLQYLASFGNAVGRQPFYRIEAAEHYPNLYVLLVGDTAMARKGTSAQHVRRIMRIADPDWARNNVAGGISSGEGIIHTIRDPIFALKKGVEELVDPGVEDKRLLLDEREFSSALDSMKREGNVVSRIIREAWDDPEVLRTITKHSPTRATRPFISIIGHITLEELRRKLDETSMADGFGNRFLYVCVKRSKCLPHGGDLDDDTVGRLGAATLEALTAARALARVTMAPAPYERWSEAYGELTKGKNNLLDYLTNRAAPQALRLALIYAALDRSAHIEQAHLEAALAAWKYCEASARLIFGDLTGDTIADTILREMRAAGVLGLSRWDLIEVFKRNVSSNKISAALMQLLAAGKIRHEMQTTGGRPREMWFAV